MCAAAVRVQYLVRLSVSRRAGLAAFLFGEVTPASLIGNGPVLKQRGGVKSSMGLLCRALSSWQSATCVPSPALCKFSVRFFVGREGAGRGSVDRPLHATIDCNGEQ